MNVLDKKPRRRRWKIAAGVVVSILLTLALIPSFLGTATARQWLLSKANHALYPGKLDVSRFRFSWFSPTILEGFTIRREDGRPVVETSRAVWDRSLYRILFDRPRYGTLRLENAKLDVHRLEDGKIDLAETLRPILNGEDETDLRIEISQGQFQLQGQGLMQPVRADRFDLSVHRAAKPEPTTWKAVLANGDGESLG